MLNKLFKETVSVTETTKVYSRSQLVHKTEIKITRKRDYRANNSITKSNFLNKLGNWFTSLLTLLKLFMNDFNNCNQSPVWSLL